jgi:hypothetical protein
MRTASEQLFETYLHSHELNEFDYEPEIAGTTRRPDYRVRLTDSEILFEVKEFEPPKTIPAGGSFDPYPPIRSKIEKAREKFRALKGQMCGIVLANSYGSFVFLEPMVIFGAMLGNVGITMPFDAKADAYDFERTTQSFLSRGKMIRYKNGQAIAPQNTTISTVCVLDAVAEGLWRFKIRVAQLKRETEQCGTLVSILEKALETQGTETNDSRHHLRIQVYGNPYACVQLARICSNNPSVSFCNASISARISSSERSDCGV